MDVHVDHRLSLLSVAILACALLGCTLDRLGRLEGALGGGGPQASVAAGGGVAGADPSGAGGVGGAGGAGGVGGTGNGGQGGGHPLDDWAHRRMLTISAAAVEAPDSEGTLSDVPVLISTPADALLAATAQADGDDVLFTADDGLTVLAHEIEHYDDTGRLVAWVKIPLLSENIDTSIYLYYGNAAVGPQALGPQVWTSSYESVFHLSQDPGPGVVGDISDATTKHDGTATPTMETDDLVAGQVGNGIRFNGTNERIAVGSTSFGNELTISAWINLSNMNNIKTIAANSTSGGDTDGFRFFVNHHNTQDGTVLFETGNDNNGAKAHTFPAVISANNWYHVAAVVDRASGTTTIYINGVDETETSSTRSDFLESSDWELGRMENDEWQFEGTLDELRTATTLRSAEWITTTYRSQSNPAGFVGWGSEQTSPW